MRNRERSSGFRAAPGFSYTVTPPTAAGSRLEIDGAVIAGGSSAATLQWPGASESHRALLTLRPGGSPLEQESGAWSLFHLLDAAKLSGDGATFASGTHEATYRFTATPATPGAALKPLDLARLRSFHCPGGV